MSEKKIERIIKEKMKRKINGEGEEERIEKMKDRVINEEDIMIERKKVIRRIEVGRLVLKWRGKESVIKGRIEESINSVGLEEWI